MDNIVKIAYVIFALLEITYLLSCVIAIIQIVRYKMTYRENSVISTSTLIFLISCIIGSFIHNVPHTGKSGNIIFNIFIISEIAFLNVINITALRNKLWKTLFGILITSTLLFIPFLSAKEWNDVTYDPLFAYESLIATSMSFAYFIQLGDDIKSNKVLENPITLLMLGFFFCYSLPFAYNTIMATISLLDPEFYPNLRNSFKDRFLLLSVSRVGTICYLILNIFIYKAFKCRTQIQTGTL